MSSDNRPLPRKVPRNASRHASQGARIAYYRGQRNTREPDTMGEITDEEDMDLAIPSLPFLFDFKHVMELPCELKNRIFGYVLKSKNPILPHLCDRDGPHGEPKFHDDNTARHGRISRLTGLTRVSKKIRQETLPVFYSINSFAMGSDTVTYFAYLKSLGRLDQVFRVNLAVTFQPEDYAAWVLRCVNQFDKEVKIFERNAEYKAVLAAPPNRRAPDGGRLTKTEPLKAGELRHHPRYLVGGLSELNLAILLRMLSTTCSPGSGFNNRIVLPVSNAAVFNIYSGLRWFPAVVKGLGMDLRFVVRPDTATMADRTVMVTWNRRFQGCENAMAGSENKPGEDVMERALEMFPGLEAMSRPRVSCYYRTSCYSSLMTWYDVPTMGGGQ